MNYWGGAGLYGSCEVTVMHFVKEKLEAIDAPVIFDVGANKGQYAMALAGVFTSSERIICFEPSGFAYKLLKDNLEKRGLQARIRAVNIGFGSQNEQVKLYGNERGTVIASVYSRSVFTVEQDPVHTEDVQLETIDNFCSENKIETIHFLKLDVEGHEYAALRGADRMLRDGRITFIQFEFGEFHIEARTFFRDFFELLNPKYQLYRIASNGLVPIRRYDAELEVFLTANYLAERRV